MSEPWVEQYREAAEAIRAGVYDISLPADAPEDVAELGQSLKFLAAAMKERSERATRMAEISRRINVETNVRGRDLASFVSEAQEAVDAEVDLPPGWVVDWGGQFENLQAASERLAILVPMALLLIFVLLYSTFGSVRLAALIYLNVPLAVTGGLLALALRGYPFSISAGVGFVALFGIAVLNGVVMVSYVVEKRQHGLGAQEAAREGALVRLRPVLMTALVAAYGFVPMALATSAGAEVQRPLATVVIGGVLSANVLTLIVLPAIYRMFGRAPVEDGSARSPATL